VQKVLDERWCDLGNEGVVPARWKYITAGTSRKRNGVVAAPEEGDWSGHLHPIRVSRKKRRTLARRWKGGARRVRGAEKNNQRKKPPKKRK